MSQGWQRTTFYHEEHKGKTKHHVRVFSLVSFFVFLVPWW